MTEIQFTILADRDLDALDAYFTEEAGPRRAKRVLARLRHRIELLQTFPRSAPAVPDDPRGRRALSVRPYVVLYRLLRDAGGEEIVLVLRIIHGSRDLAALLGIP